MRQHVSLIQYHLVEAKVQSFRYPEEYQPPLPKPKLQ